MRYLSKKCSFRLILALLTITAFFLNSLVVISAATVTYNEEEILVKFKDGANVSGTITKHDLKVSENVTKLNTKKVKFKTGKNRNNVLSELKKDPSVLYAQPNYIYKTSAIPNDPNFNLQWGLTSIKADKAWDISEGSGDIIVAVADTGVDVNHPDLASRLVYGYNAINNTNSTDDDNGHGTHVAGISSGIINNSRGIAGVAGKSKVMPIKVLDSSGSGYTFNIAKGIMWAADHGAKIINLSLGSPYHDNYLQDAINYASDKGVLIIAAAGNSNTSAPSYPAALNNVIAVSAIDRSNDRAYFSNYGSYIDIAAPGTSIYSTTFDGAYGSMSGTSMACPFVSGAAALIWSLNTEKSPAEIEDILKSTAYDLGSRGRDDAFGYGLVDVYNAIKIIEPEPEENNTPLPPSPSAPTPDNNPPVNSPTPSPNPGDSPETQPTPSSGIIPSPGTSAGPIPEPGLHPMGSVERPMNAEIISGQYNISGWFLDNSGVSKIEILVDNNFIGYATYGSLRPDIEAMFPEYENPNCGFDYTLNTSDLAKGSHLLTIRETSSGGSQTSLSPVLFTIGSEGEATPLPSPTPPLNPDAGNINYDLSEDAYVTITIHDSFDALVKTLEKNVLKKAGECTVKWDGKNSAGQPVPDGVYTYRIIAVDLAGLESEPITGKIIVERLNPSITAVMDNPDPFDPVTDLENTITYTISENAVVNIGIYNESNMLIKDLGSKEATMGSNNASWDGTDEDGQIVGNGTYTYKINATDAFDKPSKTVTGTISIGELDFPVISNFSANPNPFTPTGSNTTTITYNISKNAVVNVAVYDLANNLVKSLENDVSKKAGTQSTLWDGKNLADYIVQNGNFIVRITAVDTDGIEAEPLSGSITVTGQTGNDETQIITEVADYPDPFIISEHNNSEISFNLSVNAYLKLNIYDSNGTLIRKIWDGTSKSGPNKFTWNGMNTSGTIVDDGIYTYVISAVSSIDGKSQSTSGTIRTDSGRPVISEDNANPNPFAPSGINNTIISYRLSENSLVSLSIYDSKGKLVKTLQNKIRKMSGVNSCSWDGKDSSGRIVEAGSYSYKIDAVDDSGQNAAPATGIININSENIPLIYSVSDLPDPFAPDGIRVSTIFFSLSEDADMKINIYKSNGTLVKQLLNEKVFAGHNAVNWNGQDASGVLVENGMYTYTISAVNKSDNISQVYSGSITVDFEAPKVSSVSFNPNPFLPTGTNDGVLSYSLSEPAYVTISILDNANKVIKTLEDKALKAEGSNKAFWDGINSSGFVAADGNYTYKIEAEDLVGLTSEAVTGVIIVNGKRPVITDVGDSPDPFAPNGTNSNTISFKLSEKAGVKLEIQDTNGNTVRSLLDGELSSGMNKAEWDGKNESGNIVSDGTFIYSIEATDSFGSRSAAIKGVISVGTGTPVVTIIGISPNPYKTAGVGLENIFFNLNSNAKTTIKIFDKNGLPVITLEDSKSRNSGVNQAAWDGKNSSGETVPDGKYTFEISAVSFAGIASKTQSGTIHVIKSDTLVTTIIDSPDPFSPTGNNYNTISFSTSKPCDATLDIFDATGKLVKNLFKGKLKKGEQAFTWDGKNSSGKIVPDGIYTYVLDAVTNSEKDSSHLTGTITVGSGSDALNVSINSISPDPFEPGDNNFASIIYTLSAKASVNISIYDSSNNLVQATERDVQKLAGVNTSLWDGRNLTGSLVRNGEYTVKVTATEGSNQSVSTGKITLVQALPEITEVKDSPDPFSPKTGYNTIEYSISKDAKVSINIYDYANQLVKTVFEGNVTSGYNCAAWDGTNMSGSIVPEGTYTYIINTVDLFGNQAYPVKGSITVDMTGAFISDTKVSLIPFTPTGENSVTIFYNISEDANVSVKLYNSSNIFVRTLETISIKKAGENWVTWNGRDDNGQIVNPGTYTYRIEAEDLTGNQSPVVTDTILVEKYDSTPITDVISLDEADFQKDGTLQGSLITWNPAYGKISDTIKSNRAWVNSKGIDFGGTPNGFVTATKTSGDLGDSTGVCVGFISPSFIERDHGLSDNEILNIDLLNGPADSVEVELTTLPESALKGRLISNQYSTVIVNAFDSNNRIVGSKTQTFMGVTNHNLTPVKVKITSDNPDITRVTLETTQFPYTGVWLESIGYNSNTSGNPGIVTPTPVQSTPAPGNPTPEPSNHTPAPGKPTPEPGNATPQPDNPAPTPGSSTPAPATPTPATPTKPGDTTPKNPDSTPVPTPSEPGNTKTPAPNTLTITQHSIDPDPFDPSIQNTAEVKYALSTSAKVTVAIYDNTDTLIKVLETNALKNIGSNSASWDGTNISGSKITSGTYKYIIAAAKSDNSASITVSGSFTVKITALTVTSVSDAPDPFGANGTRVSTIKFTLSKAANVTIKVYDSSNKLVKTIVDSNLNSGINTVTWNGKNENGLLVKDGKYTYKLDAQDASGNKIAPITGVLDLDATPPRVTKQISAPVFIGF